jgi:hypothetical protein
MKIFGIISVFLLSLALVLPVTAQSGDGVWIEVDQQTFRVSEIATIIVYGNASVPIQGYTFQLRYDPACLQFKKTTNLVNNMNSSPLPEEPGLVDETFYSTTPQSVNGQLTEVTFATISPCAASIALENAALVVLDAAKMPQPLQLSLSASELTLAVNGPIEPGSILPGPDMSQTSIPVENTATPVPIISAGIVDPVSVSVSAPAATALPPHAAVPTVPSWIYILLMLAVGLMVIWVGIMVLLLRRQPVQASASLTPAGIPSLTIKDGPEAGQSFSLAQFPCRIGRGESNEINLSSQHLSRQHAQIYKSHNAYYVNDLGSKNGTYVNGKRIRNQSIVLRNGDHLKLGRNVLAVFKLQMDMEMTV